MESEPELPPAASSTRRSSREHRRESSKLTMKHYRIIEKLNRLGGRVNLVGGVLLRL